MARRVLATLLCHLPVQAILLPDAQQLSLPASESFEEHRPGSFQLSRSSRSRRESSSGEGNACWREHRPAARCGLAHSAGVIAFHSSQLPLRQPQHRRQNYHQQLLLLFNRTRSSCTQSSITLVAVQGSL
ncbi:hypothetical protein AUEXF2481DRAFT_43953 [Aureobasidium subglaciale EXF-2481]|uniref:Uncharacterized protein n=1 Tax=Aureobasidium subglaciale (strain EXF-2481) TaxID=1043005 RepID=A0A074YXM3_AURSE|nr:uncharacterized protein AUEXF2481DRAFT_43953 [Aureobasidium subglaciale EXF-2481]KEQ91581.1 hypothetical protein AUEXF2481DRAFT_43953 [Aureobasidium subglaciale EXF-2481]